MADLSKGYWRHKQVLKEGVIPPDYKTKFAYSSEDFEVVDEFIPYTEEEQAYADQQITPQKVKEILENQEDIILAIADLIGGDNAA